ncbi:MAG: riboflavin biosynthesis protein RibF [Candidatus Krumholzibacteria bacterium]|jgi:riboflavin kinase/FMN adenylyltransferase|nr:riboflavin biosynthesis protein RibF [Candidatus Krumholzibacteria bacterium]MDP6668733.1 riboflavin biosynthesis protein RibF [Candidatus Krumholzibacteria bacterium]MDP6797319.1 riboflavin biosynthesis protein RibF [Candidatus Krumholzibacteria bacterium]MDP7021194.1 riboflavin biosynthesis protein RibF [Candidatus Krumholzibacteria bacterium]
MIYRDPAEVPGGQSRSVAVGVFDGIHRGHAKILDQLKLRKDEESLDTSLVLSFDPHPLAVTRPEQSPSLICTPEERCLEIGRRGIDEILLLPFSPEWAALPFEQFCAEVLSSALGTQSLVIGEDFRMGRDREGGIEELRKEGALRGFSVEVIPPCLHEGQVISSTRIRRDLREGRLEEVAAQLGRPWRLSGRVVRGAGKGRELGFPTANLDAFLPEKLLPPPGVYRVEARLEDAAFPGLMNLGWAPTLRDSFVAEVHLLDFHRDLLGEVLELDIFQRIRDEQRFPDLASLVRQIEEDVRNLRRFLGRNS